MSSDSKTKCPTAFNDQRFSNRMWLEVQASSSNDILSDADQRLIREMIAEAEDDIKSLDAEISRPQVAIANLEMRRTECLARIERLKVGIAPHKNIPPEIVSKIFVCCAHMDGPMLNLPPHYRDSIWNMIQVCSRWRSIAMSEPLLWNQLSIRAPSEAEALNDLIHDIFSNRGRQGTISYEAFVTCLREWEDILNLLSTYPSRLQSLVITLVHFIPPSLAAPLAPFDHLDSISISFRELNTRDDIEHIAIKAFSASHNLRKVEVYSDEYDIDIFSMWPSRILLPWAQLTDLTIDAITTPIFSIILSLCVQLIHCEFGLQDSLSHDEPQGNLVRLENLSSIYVREGSDYPPFERLCELLVVPMLRSLEFGWVDWEQWPQNAVLNLIDRSGCNLEKFRTREVAPTPDEVVQLMRAMPRLIELFVDNSEPMSESILNTILSENLSPNLHTLHGWQFVSTRSFMRFLQSRWAGRWGGIRDAAVWVPLSTFTRDEEYYKSMLPELEENGTIKVLPYW